MELESWCVYCVPAGYLGKHCFSVSQVVTALAMLVRRFDFSIAPGAPPVSRTFWKASCLDVNVFLQVGGHSPRGFSYRRLLTYSSWCAFRWQVEMTTGATIHTSAGLLMNVARRRTASTCNAEDTNRDMNGSSTPTEAVHDSNIIPQVARS